MALVYSWKMPAFGPRIYNRVELPVLWLAFLKQTWNPGLGAEQIDSGEHSANPDAGEPLNGD